MHSSFCAEIFHGGFVVMINLELRTVRIAAVCKRKKAVYNISFLFHTNREGKNLQLQLHIIKLFGIYLIKIKYKKIVQV